MNHHHKHHTTVTEPTGDANPDNHQLANSSSELGSAMDVRARISELPVVTSTEHFGVRVSSEGNVGLATSTVDDSDRNNDHAEAHVPGKGAVTEKLYDSDGKSVLSDFDDYVGSDRNGGGGVSRGLGHGFEVGDMVWGKVKSHPWWPGHIYNEAFASPTVRRTKKEGLVLVAFFGDGSYGWFEPAQLIPFHANFAEKSKQTNLRTFIKAVEESVDEASRRCAIGLICKCKNPDSFRPTKFQGYFSVHVQDYDPGIYSEAQIRKARYGFGPAHTLAFIKQLAIDPHGGGDVGSLSFSKNKATVIGLRCTLYELYDEPYDQAFGTQPLHVSNRHGNPLDRPWRNPAGAPLSGPLRVAETSANEKDTLKSIKDNFKKDNYNFKCRDVASNSYQLASPEEETSDAGRGSIFEKNPLAVSVAPWILEKHEGTGFINLVGGVSAIEARVAVEEQVQPDSSGFASQEITLGEKHHLFDKGNETSEEITKSFEFIDVASKSKKRLVVLALPSIMNETSLSPHLERKTSTNVKNGGNVILPGLHENFQQKEQGFLTITDELKHHKLGVVDGMVKKRNAQKRPADDSNSESSAVKEKKKKRKETLNLQPTSGHLEKPSASEKSVHLSGELIGKPVSIGLAPRENLHSEPVEVDVSASNLLPVCNITKVNELPQIFYELQALALDPFHGVKRGIPAVVRQFFLQFRSLVYQKSLPLSPPTESGALEIHATKSPSSFRASENPTDHASALPLVKPVKHIVRPDDPTKDGRKRALSERQEDISAKRVKKITDLKALATVKKAAYQKFYEAQQVDVKESAVQDPRKIVKPDSTRKVEHPAKPFEPTILIINFPPKTSLPSVAELKARFARFGPIDQSGLRVFWKSLSCRVVFLHKNDAQAAYKFAVGNQYLFGIAGVRYYLRESGDSSSNVSKAGNTPRIKDPAVVQHQQPSVSGLQPLLQPIKSILKKSSGDESVSGQGADNGGSSRGTPRVKFMLGGEESNRGEQLVVDNRNNFNNDGSAPSRVAMDFNSTNVQKVISQRSLPNLPIPTTQFTKIPQHNLRSSEKPERNIPNFINTTVSVTPNTVDISQPMILLLTRCHDVVTNLAGLLGYVPYHPL